ncbi:MAG TPA: hypothetical protein VH701_18950 [Vicinamibacterales bacterium]
MRPCKRTGYFLVVTLWVLCAAHSTSTGNVPPPESSPPAAQSKASSSKVWVGRYAAYEKFLRTAVIERATSVGSSQHVFFKPGGLVAGGSLKAEAYKLEIAGYQLDRVLSLDMVPPTVEVRSNGEPVSLQLWVDNTRLLSQIRATNVSPPDPARWNAQLQRAYVFENLVANLDPNEGTPVVDPLWNLIILDHSRGFTDTLAQPYEIGKTLNQIDRAFFNQVKKLNKATVRRAIRDLVDAAAIDALFMRRDNLVKAFEKLATERGANQVFTR